MRALEVVDLACRRGDRVLFSDLSFGLDTGSLLHVRGRNGCGKTTLLRALCGLLQPESGEIHWQGENVRQLGEDYFAATRFIGHLNGIKGDLDAIENLRVAATLDDDDCHDDQLYGALDQVGLAGYEDLPTRVLSQGQKRRVALARLWLGKAPLWILDEPFTALDTDAVERLLQRIAAHVDDGGIAVLTTHQDVSLDARSERLELGG